MSVIIREADSGKRYKDFITLPYTLYKNTPAWIPPLKSEEKKAFRPATNPYLQRCLFQHFIAYKKGVPAGRISAFIDELSNQVWEKPVGLFGSYECIDDHSVAHLLLDTAVGWLKKKNMKTVQGPLLFQSQEWGFLTQAYDKKTMIMEPYNHPWYLEQMEIYGFRKVKDLLSYTMDTSRGYVLPERFIALHEKLLEKHQIVIRKLDMKHLTRDVKKICDIANRSTRQNWGYVPVTNTEAEDMAASLKPVVDPDIIMIAESRGEPVGYLIVLPDINQLLDGLNGRLFPRGLFRLLFKKHTINRYRVWALGIIPSFQRKALELYKILMAKHPQQVDANYVLEDNSAMNNAIIKMGFREEKRYRIYEKSI